MSVRGATMVYLEDGSIDTVERLYREGIREFKSFALNSNGKAVKTTVSDLRIDENQVSEFYHVVFGKSYELVCDKWQKVMKSVDGSIEYTCAKDLTDQDILKCMMYYLKGNNDHEFIDTSIAISSVFHRKARHCEHTYCFETIEHNILVPQVIVNTNIPWPVPVNKKMHFVFNKPTSIKFIAVHDGSIE